MTGQDGVSPQSIERVTDCSPFCASWRQANSARFDKLAETGALEQAMPGFDAISGLPEACEGDEAVFMSRLRELRNEFMFIIAWRDLAGIDSLDQTLSALTTLAERCIEAALQFAARRKGLAPDSLVILGMGKLGGGELNFSSDIDLIFAHDNLDDEEAEAERSQLCRKLAQRMVKYLNEQTADGFVYRVDTRLRPFGEAGPLVASFDAIEHYYQTHGREWERYALIKARPVAGDRDGGRRLLRRLRPFIYRRYLDFGAYESMRDMKSLIEKQVRQRGMQDNVKLGRGGIREIEFIAQAFQLIRGGHEQNLQNEQLQPTLEKLKRAGHLPARVVDELQTAYVYLRRLENRLQMWQDRQTHDLPTEPLQQAALARSMDCADWPTLLEEVGDVRDQVNEHFDQVFVAPQTGDGGDQATRELRRAWEAEDEEGAELLAAAGLVEPETAWKGLLALQDGSLYASLGDRGRRRLAELVPLMVQAAATQKKPDRALERLLRVIDRIIGRTTYVALLVENPAVLSRLVTLCSASPWITEQIEAQPVLLDSLIDPRVLFRPPRAKELSEILTSDLGNIAEDDLEARMDALRRFVQEQMLRVAAADVTNAMPLMTVSDHLTDLAEVTLRAALEESWRQLSARHGDPLRDDGEMAGFSVIGYGKLGGQELGYGSDLDVVFIHGGREDADTNGNKPISHAAFFLRLAQRLIHHISTQTGAGRAYEIDTRLRPSGRSGLLVVSAESFERYQRDKAWTWEHQALVRARPVAGDENLADGFRALRKSVLQTARDPETLRGNIRDMRERMRTELDRSNDASFDLKQGRGGLVDIEFIAQFAVLLLGGECEELCWFTDTIRIIETLESGGYLSYEDATALTHAYRGYRRAIHSAGLQQVARAAKAGVFDEERSQVLDLWQRMIDSDWPQPRHRDITGKT